MIAIVSSPIDVASVLESVKTPSAGGIDVFVGTTRNHSHGREVLALEYEAYQPMALEILNHIAVVVKQQWEIERLSMIHRIGRVEIGDASVVIAVSAVHRREAFEACRYAIDTLKRDVPIWKKEFFADGEVWVSPKM